MCICIWYIRVGSQSARLERRTSGEEVARPGVSRSSPFEVKVLSLFSHSSAVTGSDGSKL